MPPELGVQVGEELAHDGGDGDLEGLSCRSQSLVKIPENRVVPRSNQSRHVESVPG